MNYAGAMPAGKRSTSTGCWSVNGTSLEASCDVRRSLLDLLREDFGLSGTKKGCDRGECGACTVHLDGRPVLSCLMPAVMAEHHEITTIEAIGSEDELHPLQAAFVEHDALQCGFCTSGQIMSALAFLQRDAGGGAADVRAAMSGNLCRCGAYQQIRAAVASVGASRG